MRKSLSKEVFDARFNAVKNKQEKLKKYGLAENDQTVPDYSEDGAKILSVYLDDIEQKLSAYDNLLDKLDVFTASIENRKFTYKSIHIDKNKGFLFKTEKGVGLELSELSSGEQHQVILLYELIFNLEPNTLVLVDEPEISLHVAWQEMFISDLLKIIKLQNLQAIVATHSPMIIDIHSNLKYDLYGSPKRQQIL